MALYVALVAILNLAIGYALAVFIRHNRNALALAAGDSANSHEEYESDEWDD